MAVLLGLVALGVPDLARAELKLATLNVKGMVLPLLTHLRRDSLGEAAGGEAVCAFVESRQEQKAANATINRELATLRRMLRLAYKEGKLLRLPVFDDVEGARAARGLLRARPVRSGAASAAA